MKISVEVGHPSHVHYWKNVIRILEKQGHDVEILAREKEITLQILKANGFDYHVVGSSKPTLLWKAIDMPIEDLRVLRIARKMGVRFMLSTGIPGSAHASRVLGVPHISLIDTEIARLGRLLTEPFSDAVCTPECFAGVVDAARHVTFKGYLELMYLHPRYFTPDRTTIESMGLSPEDTYAIVRFSSWDSSHDIGRPQGILTSDVERLQIVKELSENYRVFLTSEVPLPSDFEQYRLPLPPEKFHDLLAFASLYVGEGAKTASEAGVLGVPWVYLSKSRRGYLDDQERRYSTGRTVGSLREARDFIYGLIGRGGPERKTAARKRLLEDTIDVTEFMAELVDKWPDSKSALLREAAGPQTSASGRVR